MSKSVGPHTRGAGLIAGGGGVGVFCALVGRCRTVPPAVGHRRNGAGWPDPQWRAHPGAYRAHGAVHVSTGGACRDPRCQPFWRPRPGGDTSAPFLGLSPTPRPSMRGWSATSIRASGGSTPWAWRRIGPPSPVSSNVRLGCWGARDAVGVAFPCPPRRPSHRASSGRRGGGLGLGHGLPGVRQRGARPPIPRCPTPELPVEGMVM